MLSAIIACMLCLQGIEKPIAMPASRSDPAPIATVAVTSAGPDSIVVSEPCVRDGQHGLLLTVYRLSPDRKLSRCSETFHPLSGAMVQTPKRPWGPEQATGAPDTPRAGDIPTAWASETEDGQDEWLLLEYATPVVPRKVAIYETYNPGAVNKVSVFTQDGREVIAWQGQDPTAPGSGMGVSTIPLDVHVRTQRVKVYVNSREIPGWNEIDAVGLIGENGETQWAVSATASSTYADLMGGQRPLDPGTDFVPSIRGAAAPPATESGGRGSDGQFPNVLRASAPAAAPDEPLLSDAITEFNRKAKVMGAGVRGGGDPVPYPHGRTEPEDLPKPPDVSAPLDDGAVAKVQPELTVDEVLAAIDWLLVKRDSKDATPDEYATLDKIAKTRRLADGATFEVLTGYEPNDRMGFTVWSIRLVIPRKDGLGTHAIGIREQFLRVRYFGPEERKAIAKWQEKWEKQGGVASFDRLAYAEERRQARERDRQSRP